MPSSPIRFSAGTFMSSKNTSVVAWFIMVRIGRMVEAVADRLAHVDDEARESPSVRFLTCSFGVVRASSSIRSECSARLVQIFWPLTM